MEPLPRHLLPLGLVSQVIKDLPVAEDARVLPAVDDLVTLAEALKACPICVVVIGPDWPPQDLAAARELILDHAAACVVATNLDPAALQSAISAAIEERDRRVESGFFTQLVHLLPDPVYFKDRYGRFLAANPFIAKHLRVDDPAVLIGRSDFDFFSSEHAQQAFTDEQEVMRTGQPITALLEKETHDGDRVTWCVTWKAPLLDQSGRVIGTYGFSRDQTNLKNTEIALATERHLLEVLLTGLPDSVFIKDREGRFLLANQVVAQWMGETPASLRGKSDTDIYPPELAAVFRKDEEDVMASGMPVINREEVINTKDGRELYVLTTKLPYRNPAGEIIGVIGMSRNITLRKGFDAEMRAAQTEIATLRSEVARLTTEVTSRLS
ncbi:MAG: PAS domain-containing protein [Opitutus sp.]|nr:PAS domain-containing protein [Opitutus sp.]MCS6275345.1 PAS domain-containing protein [Opitutus sp.]MCS6277242.1 PAS domain-containing protein [Opitutus sp.]MCS6300364.1 PAS domain-containing protein [Opitutus sp.]